MREESQSKVDRLSAFMTRHRFGVLVVSIIVAVIMGAGMFNMKGEVLLYELFPYDHPYLKLHARFSEVFGGGGSGAVIVLKARKGDIFKESILEKLQRMDNEVVLWDEVYRVLTFSIANRSVKIVKTGGKGLITIAPLMWPDVPKTDEEIEQLKRYIFSNPAYKGTLVSRDGTATLLMTEFKPNISYERAFHLLRNLTEKYSDEETSVHIVGFPMMMGWIYSYKSQIVFVTAVSVGLMLLVMVFIFRNFGGIAAPICFGTLCTAMGLGFIGWTGINFNPLMYVLAFLVGARMVSHSVQLTHRYLEEYTRAGEDKEIACYETMRKMIIPNWAGVATDAAGFLVLLFAKIIIMQLVAVFMSFWMVCIGLCGILTPILCSYMPIGKASEQWAKEKTEKDLLDRICLACAGFSMGRGKGVVVAACLVLLLFGVWQTSKMMIGDATPGTPLLWPDHQYNKDQEVVDKNFDASSENFMLFYEGKHESVYDPVVLTTFEAFARHMKQQLPDIYKSSASIINMVEMINVTFHDGDKLWFQLPRNEAMLTVFMGHVRQDTDRGTLRRFVDGQLERAQITLFFSDHTSENMLRIRKAAYDFFETHPMKLAEGEFKLAGGRIGMEIAVNEEMKRSHLIIDSMVLAAIFILCSLAFRSLLAGFMLTVPLVLANLVAFAYMSLMNIGLSINTLPVAAVGVGVGVDFAIYLYSRCIDEYSYEKKLSETVMTSVRTSGKAVVYTGLTMILPILTWYFLSDLKFQAQMGIFLAMIVGMNVLLAITLHPLMIVMINPAFLKKHAFEDAVRYNTLPATARHKVNPSTG